MGSPTSVLTIGAFARLSRLSAKALRRYDELGLLRPARVDADTGYRYYDRTQLERARLVAWLRRIGMPLARIREVCDLYESDVTGPAEAAQHIRTYWAQAEAETAARRDLVTFLIHHLSAGPTEETGKGVAAMSHSILHSATHPLGIRHAALSDRGLIRETNQDTAYADGRLLAVADGFGGNGGLAGTTAIEALKPSAESIHGADLLNALAESVEQANRTMGGFDWESGSGSGSGSGSVSGTTLTAMVWTGSQLALVHIGDTRAYLLRGGEFFQITHDDTVVQSMIDEGALTAEEALSHPQRMMLLKALGSGDRDRAQPELRLHDAQAGDRYLLCSDGLFAVVDQHAIRAVITTATEPDVAVQELVELARRAGGPDNVACVVADVVGVEPEL